MSCIRKQVCSAKLSKQYNLPLGKYNYGVAINLIATPLRFAFVVLEIEIKGRVLSYRSIRFYVFYVVNALTKLHLATEELYKFHVVRKGVKLEDFTPNKPEI